MNRVADLYQHPRARLVAWVVVVLLVVAAMFGYGDNLRRISANQQRIIQQQEQLQHQQAQIDQEIAERINSVCATALANNRKLQTTIDILTDAAPSTSVLKQPGVARRLGAELAASPPECELLPSVSRAP